MSGRTVWAGLSFPQRALPEEITEHGFRVQNLAALNGGFDFFRREPAGLDALVAHGSGDARGEAGGEKNGHLFGEETGAGEK